MGGIIKAFTGISVTESSAEKRARREKRAQTAFDITEAKKKKA